MIGCSFVVDREYFGDIGLLDPGMEVYGGENIELGMRVSGRSGHWVRRAGPPGCDELRGWSALGCSAAQVARERGPSPSRRAKPGPHPGAPACQGRGSAARCALPRRGQRPRCPPAAPPRGRDSGRREDHGRRSPRAPPPGHRAPGAAGAAGPGPRGPAGRLRAGVGSGAPAHPAVGLCGRALVGWRFLDFLCFVSGVSFVFGFCL